MNFLKSNEENNLGEIIMRTGCITCGQEDLFGESVEIEDDGGASSDGGSNK